MTETSQELPLSIAGDGAKFSNVATLENYRKLTDGDRELVRHVSAELYVFKGSEKIISDVITRLFGKAEGDKGYDFYADKAFSSSLFLQYTMPDKDLLTKLITWMAENRKEDLYKLGELTPDDPREELLQLIITKILKRGPETKNGRVCGRWTFSPVP